MRSLTCHDGPRRASTGLAPVIAKAYQGLVPGRNWRISRYRVWPACRPSTLGIYSGTGPTSVPAHGSKTYVFSDIPVPLLPRPDSDMPVNDRVSLPHPV